MRWWRELRDRATVGGGDALAVDHGEWRVPVADPLLAGEVRT